MRLRGTALVLLLAGSCSLVQYVGTGSFQRSLEDAASGTVRVVRQLEHPEVSELRSGKVVYALFRVTIEMDDGNTITGDVRDVIYSFPSGPVHFFHEGKRVAVRLLEGGNFTFSHWRSNADQRVRPSVGSF